VFADRRSTKFAAYWLLLALAIAPMGLVPGRALAQDTRSGAVRISLKPNPTTLPADGKSRARILIELRNRSEQPMPDGTQAFCTVDNGLLQASDTDRRRSLSVETTGGFATIYCLSESPGIATVTVRVLESRQRVTLQFLPEGETAKARARVVNMHGGWIGYCLDLSLIRARDGARVKFGDLLFEAVDGLEVDIQRQTLRAWGVRITRKEETIEGEDVYFELGTGRGIVRRFGDLGVERVIFNTYGVEKNGAEWDLPSDAFQSDDREGMTWLICESCLYFIGQRVVTKHAKLYAGTQKVFSFPPYWVIGLPGYSGTSNTQVVGASTDGGLAVDLPFFYRVSDKWSGSLKVQRGASGTSFIARDGWSLALEEAYESPNAKGSIEAGGLLSSEWGLEWRDERKIFGDNQGFLNVSWPDHRSLFADASIYHYGDAYRFNFRAQYDDPWLAEKSRRLVADWLTDPRRLTGDSKFRLGTSLGVRRYDGLDDDWVLENELYGSIELDPWRIGKNTKVRPSISNTYSWDTADYSRNELRGQLRVNRRLGRSTRLGMNYYLSYRNGDTQRPGANSMLGLDFSTAHGTLWSTYLNGTWDITEGDTYGYVGIDYFFKSKWRFGIIGTHYEYDSSSYDDLELELARSFGPREIGVHYSFDTDELSLELGNFGL